MNQSLVKFVYGDKDPANSHWTHCCGQRIPFVSIIKSGTKYWKIEFDAASVTQNERFVIVNYSDHVIPLYDLYCVYSNLPSDKKSYAGGGRNLVFTVFRNDAEDLAGNLFDLLLLLAQKNQELFDENPIDVNAAGANSEGTNIEKFNESLKQMNDEELGFEYKMMLFNNPGMIKTIKLIKDAIEFRNLKNG